MQSFYNRFLASAQRLPGHIVVELQKANPSTEIDAYTFADLRQKAESVAQWLRTNGIGPGDRCAILGLNSPQWVMSYLGILAAGAVAVPLDTAFKAGQVAKLLNDCGSELVFCDREHLPVAREAAASRANTRIVLLDSTEEGLPYLDQMFGTSVPAFAPHDSKADDMAVILYTSGTTSDPKGVMLTHANLDAEAKAIANFIHIDETDAILGVLPLFHALAQMANLLIPFAFGCRVVFLEQLNTTELLRALRERRITLFCCVPQFFYLIHEKVMKQVNESGGLKRFAFRVLMRIARAGRFVGLNFGRIFFAKAHQTLGMHMRYLVTGGSRFDVKIGEDLETLGFDILQAYGLTECCGGATVTPQKARFVGSVGRALPSVEVKVIEARLPDGGGMDGDGEVLIRGPIVMKGYYNRPDATAEMLQDGWLYTGDLGRIDTKGNLFITGRKKDVIVLSSGKNVYPEEIEAHYLQSQWIKEMCVMGLRSQPGEPFSERLHAVVVPNMEVLREKKIVNMKEVLRFDIEGLSAEITAGKRILSYEIWQSDLPRTTTRKLKRHEIQKAVEGKQTTGSVKHEERPLTDEEQRWMSLPAVSQALEVIRKATKDARKVYPSDNLELELGLDSMERVELVVALESSLKAQADPNMISEVYTVRELVDAVIAGQGASPDRVSSGWEEVFKRESTDPDVLAILEPRPIAVRLWYAFGCCVSAFCKVFFRLETRGLEKLPKSGPFILCPNHQSFLDGPIVTSQMPFPLQKDLFYVGTSEVFGSGPMRKLARSIKLIPVDPDANLVPAMQAGAFGLAHGKILVLYPEGERSIDGEPKLFKKGAAILAVHHNVPIYPVALEGFHEVWPRGKRPQGLHKLRISIGDPIFPPQGALSLDEKYERMTRQLRESVMALWQPLRSKNTRAAAAGQRS